MKFEWDAYKAKSNLLKHKISFEEAIRIFNDPFHLSIYDGVHSINEDRWVTIGTIVPDKRIVLVVHTFKDETNTELIRVVSARKATANERRQYLNRIG
jgi:hypothetical protein